LYSSRTFAITHTELEKSVDSIGRAGLSSRFHEISMSRDP
jgi:hypothetical protein